MKKNLTYLTTPLEAFKRYLKSLTVKKVLISLFGIWFMELSFKHKFYCFYTVPSIISLCCLASEPSWVFIPIILNAVIAAILTNHIPFKELSK